MELTDAADGRADAAAEEAPLSARRNESVAGMGCSARLVNSAEYLLLRKDSAWMQRLVAAAPVRLRSHTLRAAAREARMSREKEKSVM